MPATPLPRTPLGRPGLPRRLLSDAAELFSSEQSRERREPLRRAALLHSRPRGQPRTAVHLQPAGAFDLLLLERRRRAARRGCSAAGAPFIPAEPFDTAFSSTAEPGGRRLRLSSTELLQTSHPGRKPQELAGVLFYTHFLCLPDHLCAEGAGPGAAVGSHRVSGAGPRLPALLLLLTAVPHTAQLPPAPFPAVAAHILAPQESCRQRSSPL